MAEFRLRVLSLLAGPERCIQGPCGESSDQSFAQRFRILPSVLENGKQGTSEASRMALQLEFDGLYRNGISYIRMPSFSLQGRR